MIVQSGFVVLGMLLCNGNLFLPFQKRISDECQYECLVESTKCGRLPTKLFCGSDVFNKNNCTIAQKEIQLNCTSTPGCLEDVIKVVP